MCAATMPVVHMRCPEKNASFEPETKYVDKKQLKIEELLRRQLLEDNTKLRSLLLKQRYN